MSFFAASIPPLQCHFNELEINFQSTIKTFEFIPVKDNYQRDSLDSWRIRSGNQSFIAAEVLASEFPRFP